MTIKVTAAVLDMDAILDTADIFDMAAILAMATALDTEAIIAMATILAIKYKLLKYTYKKERLQLKSLFFVGIPGLEPGKTGPESVVLPLHHIPRLSQPFGTSTPRSELRCKGTAFL